VKSAPLTIVVGAGISGLTCAYALRKSGQNVLLLEADSSVGGVIRSVEDVGFLFELGPQSLSSSSAIADLCDELSLVEELVEAPHGAPRYILVDGKLARVPLSPALLTSDFLSWGTKLSFVRDVFGKTSPPEPDESIAGFVRRKFSAELLDRLVGPFVSGIYAGDPEQLSLRAAFPKLYEAEKTAGSVIRGMLSLGRVARASDANLEIGVPRSGGAVGRAKPRPSLLSFQQGNETLTKALGASLGSALRCNIQVNELRRTDRGFSLAVQTAIGSEELFCEQIVLATPTAASAQVLQGIAPAASSPLREISYAPVSVVSLGYRRDQVRHSLEGFGFLVPRSSGLRTLGTVWNSSLFPGRAPQGHVLLTSFIGGATDPGASSLSQPELATLVHHEIARIIRITGEPVITRVTTYNDAIPQYNLGHLERLKTIENAISRIPGLSIIGNYWKAPSIGACIEHAQTIAAAIRID
jgi:oxygen-dependent protoporphyrinogen oxidase